MAFALKFSPSIIGLATQAFRAAQERRRRKLLSSRRNNWFSLIECNDTILHFFYYPAPSSLMAAPPKPSKPLPWKSHQRASSVKSENFLIALNVEWKKIKNPFRWQLLLQKA